MNSKYGSTVDLPGQLGVEYHPAFADDASALFETARQRLAWDDRMRARKTASCGVAYNYSGMAYPDAPIPAFLEPLLVSIASLVGHPVNNCLGNLYVDGESTMGFHSDSGEAVVPGSTTSILSLGAPRVLTFRRQRDRSHDRSREWSLELAPGSLLVMQASVQDEWQHGIRRAAGAGTRISLTFRHLSRRDQTEPRSET